MKDLFGSEEIRALSWKQPFASLMLYGKIETRKWATKYRGLVLICASKKEYNDDEFMDISGVKQMGRSINVMSPLKLEDFNGKAIAIGRLVDCRPMTINDEDKCFVKFKPAWRVRKINKDGSERYVTKRLYCHIYTDVKRIKPFNFKGAQGWKTLSREIINQIQIIK